MFLASDDSSYVTGIELFVERHGRLESHRPSRWKDGSQRVVHGADGGGMVRALRLGGDELTADQLDRLASKRVQIHQPLVLGALPAPHRERCSRHERYGSGNPEGRQCLLPDRALSKLETMGTGVTSLLRVGLEPCIVRS